MENRTMEASGGNGRNMELTEKKEYKETLGCWDNIYLDLDSDYRGVCSYLFSPAVYFIHT